uniref:Uncharacterized protein n=1 Tax=Podoviridae sp. ctZkC8 TaxID=2825259 RepID=A0A8S5UBE4_9CAUD|nr:MAG TPA: hypothetical protein [Podoviridae sp. ctZkC8]
MFTILTSDRLGQFSISTISRLILLSTISFYKFSQCVIFTLLKLA